MAHPRFLEQALEQIGRNLRTQEFARSAGRLRKMAELAVGEFMDLDAFLSEFDFGCLSREDRRKLAYTVEQLHQNGPKLLLAAAALRLALQDNQPVVPETPATVCLHHCGTCDPPSPSGELRSPVRPELLQSICESIWRKRSPEGSRTRTMQLQRAAEILARNLPYHLELDEQKIMLDDASEIRWSVQQFKCDLGTSVHLVAGLRCAIVTAERRMRVLREAT